MKHTILTLSLLLTAWTVAGCSNQALKQYVTPTYSGIGKSLAVSELKDARTSEENRSDNMVVTPVSDVMVARLEEAKLFSQIDTGRAITGTEDYSLSGSVTQYGMDESMSTFTYLPDAFVAALGIGLGVAIGTPIPIVIGVVLGAGDFLINGLLGKRQYNHDYKVLMALDLKDRQGATVWQDTLGYIYHLRFTQASYNLSSIGALAVSAAQSALLSETDQINKSALAITVSEAVELAVADIAPVVGSKRLTMNDSRNSFYRTLQFPFGTLEVTGKRIHS